MLDVAVDVPIGDMSSSKPSVIPGHSPSKRTVEVDIPEEEKAEFDEWLRQLWRDKDESITTFPEAGSFLSANSTTPDAEIPLRLRKKMEIFDAFCFFIPRVVGHFWERIRQ